MDSRQALPLCGFLRKFSSRIEVFGVVFSGSGDNANKQFSGLS